MARYSQNPQWIRPYLYALEPRFHALGFAFPNKRGLTLECIPPGSTDSDPDVYGYLSFGHYKQRMIVYFQQPGYSGGWELLPTGCLHLNGTYGMTAAGYYTRRQGVPTIRMVTTTGWNPENFPGTNLEAQRAAAIETALEAAARIAMPFLLGQHQPGTYEVCRTCPLEAVCLFDAQLTPSGPDIPY